MIRSFALGFLISSGPGSKKCPMSVCENLLYIVKPAACGGGSVTCGRPSAVLGAAGGWLPREDPIPTQRWPSRSTHLTDAPTTLESVAKELLTRKVVGILSGAIALVLTLSVFGMIVGWLPGIVALRAGWLGRRDGEGRWTTFALLSGGVAFAVGLYLGIAITWDVLECRPVEGC